MRTGSGPCTEGGDRPVSPPGLRVLMGPVDQHRAGTSESLYSQPKHSLSEVGGDPLRAQPAGPAQSICEEPGGLGVWGPGRLAGWGQCCPSGLHGIPVRWPSCLLLPAQDTK